MDPMNNKFFLTSPHSSFTLYKAHVENLDMQFSRVLLFQFDKLSSKAQIIEGLTSLRETRLKVRHQEKL